MPGRQPGAPPLPLRQAQGGSQPSRLSLPVGRAPAAWCRSGERCSRLRIRESRAGCRRGARPPRSSWFKLPPRQQCRCLASTTARALFVARNATDEFRLGSAAPSSLRSGQTVTDVSGAEMRVGAQEQVRAPYVLQRDSTTGRGLPCLGICANWRWPRRARSRGDRRAATRGLVRQVRGR